MVGSRSRPISRPSAPELFEDDLAMTAAADRAVDYHESRLQVQKLQNFPDEHRTVHGRAPDRGRPASDRTLALCAGV